MMKNTSKTTKKTTSISGPEASAGPEGVAIAPPAYGIDFLDHAATQAEAGTGPHGGLALQRKTDPSTTGDDTGTRPKNRIGAGGEYKKGREVRLQRAAIGPLPVNAVPPLVHEVLRSPGQPLDAQTRALMEPRFGHDFSGVRVHTDSQAAESAQTVNARAYTVGRDVIFGAGQYTPRTTPGRQLIAHELVHVMQQGQADNADPQAISMPGDASEREADSLAADALTKRRVTASFPLARIAPSLQRQAAPQVASVPEALFDGNRVTVRKGPYIVGCDAITGTEGEPTPPGLYLVRRQGEAQRGVFGDVKRGHPEALLQNRALWYLLEPQFPTTRARMQLHPGTHSSGCITIVDWACFPTLAAVLNGPGIVSGIGYDGYPPGNHAGENGTEVKNPKKRVDGVAWLLVKYALGTVGGAPAAQAEKAYKVKPEERIEKIAADHNVTVAALVAKNTTKLKTWHTNKGDVRGFNIGETITLPEPEGQAPAKQTAAPQPHESLETLAWRLFARNPVGMPYAIEEYEKKLWSRWIEAQKSLLDEKPATNIEYADWLLRAVDQGFAEYSKEFDTRKQLEDLKKGEMLGTANPKSATLIRGLVTMHGLVKASAERWIHAGSNWSDKPVLILGSFIRPGEGAGPHGSGRAIDINLGPGDFTGEPDRVFRVLEDLPAGTYQIGLPAQGQFFPADHKLKTTQPWSSNQPNPNEMVAVIDSQDTSQVFTDRLVTFTSRLWKVAYDDQKKQWIATTQPGKGAESLLGAKVKTKISELGKKYTLSLFMDRDNHIHIDRWSAP